MSSPWDGAAWRTLDQFDSGFAMGRAKKRDQIGDARYAEDDAEQDDERAYRRRMSDKAAATADEERAYGRRKDLGFQDEASFREQMRQKRDLERRAAEADIAYKGRMPADRGGASTLSAELQGLRYGIGDIDAQEAAIVEADEIDPAKRSIWKPWFLEERKKLPPEESQMRDDMRKRRLDLLRVGPGAKERDPEQVYLEARRQGKSKAEARSIAEGR